MKMTKNLFVNSYKEKEQILFDTRSIIENFSKLSLRFYYCREFRKLEEANRQLNIKIDINKI